MNTFIGSLAGFGLFLFFVALIAIVPLLTLWSLNVLFGLAIPYTLKTWFASLFLSSVVASSGYSSD